MNQKQLNVKARRQLLAALREFDAGDTLMAGASVGGAYTTLAKPFRARGERIGYSREAQPAQAREHLTRALKSLKTNRRAALAEAGRAFDALVQLMRESESPR